jgi:DNA-binding NarL/FixJ family response regulator
MSVSVSGVNVTVEGDAGGSVHPVLLNDLKTNLFELAMRFLPHIAEQSVREDAASEIVLSAIVAAKKKGTSPEPYVVFTAKVAGKRLIQENSPLQPNKKTGQGHQLFYSLDGILESDSREEKIAFGFGASNSAVESEFCCVEMDDFISRQSEQDRKILELKKRGFSNSEVAKSVGLTPQALHYHLNKLKNNYKGCEAA